MEGIERLEAEVLEMNNPSVSVIFNYLKSRKDLYQYFNNAEKSIKQMYKFIYERARKQQKDNVAVIDDKVVFLWAVLYFTRSNEELGLNEKKAMPPSSEEVIKKINKKKEEEKNKDNQLNLFKEVDS